MVHDVSHRVALAAYLVKALPQHCGVELEAEGYVQCFGQVLWA